MSKTIKVPIETNPLGGHDLGRNKTSKTKSYIIASEATVQLVRYEERYLDLLVLGLGGLLQLAYDYFHCFSTADKDRSRIQIQTTFKR
jgi:hypothetical protein